MYRRTIADVSRRWGRQAASATFLATRSEAPDGTDRNDGVGGQATYSFESKPFVFIVQGEHYDRGFQMDTAFLNQSAPVLFRRLRRRGVLEPEPWDGPRGVLLYRFVKR